jgi:hypothetical protein
MPRLKRGAQITLEFIEQKYKWIARNRDLTLTVFENYPQKTDDEWIDAKAPSLTINDPNEFPMITWEDESATLIDSLIMGY